MDSSGAPHARTTTTWEDAPNTIAEEGDGDRAPRSQALAVNKPILNEREPLNVGRMDRQGMTRYGSIIGSPPQDSPTLRQARDNAPSLKLPAPAMDPEDINDDSMSRPRSYSRPSSPKSPDLSRTPTRPNGDHSGNAFEVGKTKHSLAPRYRSIFQPKRVNSMPGTQDARPLVKRMMSLGGRHQNAPSQDDIAMDAYREVDFRQAEFFMFLDREMEKIEDFYKSKEDEATERLKVLREQLHIMRDRRLEEIMASQTAQLKHQSQSTKRSSDALLSPDRVNERTPILGGRKQRSLSAPWLADVARPFERAKPGRVGKTSQAMKELGTPSGPRAMDEERDYILRPGSHEVPYRTAKRKLKIALAEYYRGLELLKSYALLNRTAFRKINKKFDKTVNARPSGRYMAEKVNKAYFVRSEVLDGHLQAVEDLYARYFERGNHKIAVGKLRAKIARAGDYTASVFRNGLLFAAGSVFGIEGLTYGAELLYHPDAVTSTHTSYLMQVCFSSPPFLRYHESN